MKEITLTQGYVAIVDDADYAAVSAFKWRVLKDRRRVYAARGLRRPDGSWTLQRLHLFLMPDAKEVDHVDGDGLNNRRENLRAATNQQNQQGFQRKRLGKTSEYRGVCWSSQYSKWRATVNVGRKQIHLGYFFDPGEAARAFDAAARKYFGERASSNFP